MSVATPFSTRMGLVLAGLAGALVLAIMVMMSSAAHDTATVSGHGAANGLDGYAGLARMLAAAGHDVQMARGRSDTAGLLIVTPPAGADGAKIAEIVTRHRRVGPVLIIAPKWQSEMVGKLAPGAKTGWVSISGAQLAHWKGFLDDITVATYHATDAAITGPDSGPTTSRLPFPTTAEEGQISQTSSATLRPIAMQGPHILAARYDDSDTNGEHLPYPLTLVFEPDLLNNAGLARRDNADLAEALVAAAGQTYGGGSPTITFDLTLNGLGHPANLMGLIFSPPYLSATLCLILAALAAFWHGFARFGRPVAETRAIALGKAALVANGARLIRRARRLHLLTHAYADATRTRLVRALGLARGVPIDVTDAAIDRVLAHRATPDTTPDTARNFTSAAAALAHATTEADILAAAQNLHALERTLTP